MVAKKGKLKTKKIENFLAFNRRNRKGQLKIQQMAFVLIALTLFFVIVGLFVLTISFSGLKESADILKEEAALTLVSQIADSPEFRCGNVFSGTKLNCVDGDKLVSLNLSQNRYKKFWNVDGIKIKTIYPKFEDEDGKELEDLECHQGTYPECNQITILSSVGGIGTGVSNFISLCRKNLDTERYFTPRECEDDPDVECLPEGCEDDSELDCEEVEIKRYQDKCELAKLIVTYKT